MQRFLHKTSTFLQIARSGFKPTFSVSQMRWRQSRTIPICSKNLQSRSLMTQIPSLFSTTQNRSEEETKKEDGLPVPNQNEAKSDAQMAEEILKYICSDLQEIYTNQEFKKTPLHKLLFEDGIHINELITLPPQDRLIKGSFNVRNARESHCVFFPNTIFQQIFQICESLIASEKTLITAQQGLGKTYALALYVYLKRKQSNCRVFYIHNCQSFIDRPLAGFILQIVAGFAEELRIPELGEAFKELTNVILYDRKATMQESIKEIDIFSAKLASHLRRRGLKVYMIVDQVNVFAKERNKIDGVTATKILNTFDNALGGTRNIYVASKTYEDIISQSQERPEKELIPPLQPEESLKAYIRFLAGSTTLNDETIQSIVNITGGIPLEVRMFFEYLGSKQLNQEVFKDYKRKQIDLLRIKFNYFLNQDERHFKNMVLAFEGLIKNGHYDSGMDRTKIDQRFLYVNVSEQKIYPLSPLVKEALKECYLQDSQNIDQVVQYAQNKPAMLGYLVEAEIQKLAFSWLFSSNFILPKASMSADDTAEKGNLGINTSTDITDFGDKHNSNILEILKNNGYHNVHSNFPVFDGILVQDDKLVLVQIKRRPSKKLQEVLSFFQQEIENFISLDKKRFTFENINKDPRAVGMVSKQEMIRFVLSECIQKNKSLDIIFTTSEGPLKNRYYKQMTNEGKILTIRFVELTVRNALEMANMSEKAKDILSKTQEQEINLK